MQNILCSLRFVTMDTSTIVRNPVPEYVGGGGLRMIVLVSSLGYKSEGICVSMIFLHRHRLSLIFTLVPISSFVHMRNS